MVAFYPLAPAKSGKVTLNLRKGPFRHESGTLFPIDYSIGFQSYNSPTSSFTVSHSPVVWDSQVHSLDYQNNFRRWKIPRDDDFDHQRIANSFPIATRNLRDFHFHLWNIWNIHRTYGEVRRWSSMTRAAGWSVIVTGRSRINFDYTMSRHHPKNLGSCALDPFNIPLSSTRSHIDSVMLCDGNMWYQICALVLQEWI